MKLSSINDRAPKDKKVVDLRSKPEEDKVIDARTPSKKNDGLGKGWRTLRQDA
jgi:hypothetical protein